MNKLKNTSGLTLIEVLVSFFILSVGILSSLMFFTSATASTELARDMTTANTHAEYVLEEMHSRAALTDITAEEWPDWTSANGLNTLPQETITVTFTDPSADPLPINVTVTWKTKERAHTLALETEMTK